MSEVNWLDLMDYEPEQEDQDEKDDVQSILKRICQALDNDKKFQGLRKKADASTETMQRAGYRAHITMRINKLIQGYPLQDRLDIWRAIGNLYGLQWSRTFKL